jgi:hypothetical protein
VRTFFHLQLFAHDSRHSTSRIASDSI